MVYHKLYSNITDAAGNLVISNISGYILSIFPFSSDLVIDRYFTTPGNVRYIHTARQSSSEIVANTEVSVNILYKPY